MPIEPADIRFDPQGNAFSGAFDDIYFNPDHAAGKTEHLFHRATRFDELLAELQSGTPVVVGELGFGLGLNFLGTWAKFLRDAPTGSRLHYVGFDLAPPSHTQLRQALGGFAAWRPLVEQLLAAWPGRVAGVHRLGLARCELTLHFGEVSEMLPAAGPNAAFDAWFLDGFAPEKNPAMWTAGLWHHLARLTRPGGRLGSYTAAGHVRRGLAEAGFEAERLPGDPFKRHIVTARKPGRAETSATPREVRSLCVAVVGAGWAGLRVAEELHRRGHAVTVVDAGPLPGAGASGNAQAIGAPVLDAARSPRQDFYRSAFVLASRRITQAGVLRRPDRQKDGDALRQAADVFGSLDGHLAWDDGRSGLWMPTAGVVRFADLAGALRIREGMRFEFGFEAETIDRAEDKWQVRSADGRTADADAVVLACAATVRRFAPTAAWPLQRIRGQVSHVRGTRESKKLDHAIVGEAYLCPAHEGYHSVGATFAPASFAPGSCAPGSSAFGSVVPPPRPEDDDDNRRRARRTAPDWADAMDWSGVTGRASFRCNTPDYLPMIGRVPDVPRCLARLGSMHPDSTDPLPMVPNLFAVTALGSHGVIGAALAGPLIADLIAGTPLPCSAEAAAAVAPERYLRRAAKRRQTIRFPSVDG